jgi:hypothetical protein
MKGYLSAGTTARARDRYGAQQPVRRLLERSVRLGDAAVKELQIGFPWWSA